MKKSFLIVFTFFSILVNAQKISADYIDEFNNAHIKRTEWEQLTFESKAVTHYRFSKIDDQYVIQLKIMRGGNFFSVNENDELMLKLINSEIVTLKSIQYSTTCVGCGSTGINGSQSQGISVGYKINNEQYDLLTQNIISKIRIHTNNSFIDLDIKNKKAIVLQNSLILIK